MSILSDKILGKPRDALFPLPSLLSFSFRILIHFKVSYSPSLSYSSIFELQQNKEM
jgi:hypothetical protein